MVDRNSVLHQGEWPAIAQSKLNEWLDFCLENDSNFRDYSCVIMIGHKLAVFDIPLWFNHLRRSHVDLLRSMPKISGICDSFTLATLLEPSVWPYPLPLTLTGKSSYSNPSIYYGVFGKTLEGAHNAIVDVEGSSQV
eukprot:Lithocolla_globosa_v1_NODE_23_length_9337_cov_35.312756.p3 type:complete len:137 gc:universal NODE_23_length_9337_cov_35.312756:4315-4725(+)